MNISDDVKSVKASSKRHGAFCIQQKNFEPNS